MLRKYIQKIAEKFNGIFEQHFTLDDLLIKGNKLTHSQDSFFYLQANNLFQSIFESSGKHKLPYPYIVRKIEQSRPNVSVTQWPFVKATAVSRLEDLSLL